MNFVISEIESRRKDYPDMEHGDKDTIAKVNKRMLTIDGYHTLARRIIGKWAPSHAKAAMLHSEDAIDFVAHHIMIGDWGYDSSKSDITTYRGYCGKRAISAYLNAAANQKTAITNILDFEDNSEYKLYDTIQDVKCGEPTTNYIRQEEIGQLNNKLHKYAEHLTPTQRKCILMYYINEMNMNDIAHELKITSEGVRKSIKTGLKIMRKIAEGNNLVG